MKITKKELKIKLIELGKQDYLNGIYAACASKELMEILSICTIHTDRIFILKNWSKGKFLQMLKN